MLSKFKHIMDRRSLERIYISQIRPLLEYADVVWAGGCDADLHKLDSIQRDSARLVTGIELLFRDVGWQLLRARRTHQRLTLFYKVVNGLAPSYMNPIMPDRTRDRTRYPLRNAGNYTVPLRRLQCLSTSFIPATLSDWNSLTHHIKEAPSLLTFKSRLVPDTKCHNPLFFIGTCYKNILLA